MPPSSLVGCADHDAGMQNIFPGLVRASGDTLALPPSSTRGGSPFKALPAQGAAAVAAPAAGLALLTQGEAAAASPAASPDAEPQPEDAGAELISAPLPATTVRMMEAEEALAKARKIDGHEAAMLSTVYVCNVCSCAVHPTPSAAAVAWRTLPFRVGCILREPTD